MSIKQIAKIKSKDKENIMRSIFDNYNHIQKLKTLQKVKIDENNYRQIELYALTDSVINLMDKNEIKIITDKYLFNIKETDTVKLSSTIDKFVYYLLV